MKKDLSPNSLSLFDQFEDTKNPCNCKSEAIRHLQKLADAAAQNRNLPTPSYDEKNITALTKCVVDFLSLSGHKAILLSQSQPIRVYQKTIYDDIPNNELVATWIPNPKLHGVLAEVLIALYGETVKIEVAFDQKSQADVENGRYHLHVRSFEEFLQWYNSTFGEGAL